MIDPYEPATTGYHLFFEPKGEVAESMRETISQLADAFGGPLFEPHVTLLARIPDAPEADLMRVSESLAARLAPREITVGGLGMEDRYFRALYAFVEPREDLMEDHRIAAAAFNMPETMGYVPHLSLLYGNYPEADKHAAFPDLFSGEGTRFLADTLYLWRTPGDATTWECVSEFPILGTDGKRTS